MELWATSASGATARITIMIAADFAHIFDVKAGRVGRTGSMRTTTDGVALLASDGEWETRVRWDRTPDVVEDG